MTKKDDGDQQKSWKERMEELIIKSKKEKFERKNAKEKMVEETQAVDKEWKEVASLLQSSKVVFSPFIQCKKNAKKYENHLNPVMFVFIG